MGFLLMEAVSMLGLVTVGTRAFGEGDSYIAAGLGTVLGALIGASSEPSGFLQVLQALLIVLVGSGVIQLVFTLPLFVKKLITSKNWITLGALSLFIIYTISFLVAQNFGWLNNTIAYWVSTFVLIALGLFTCRELLCGLKKNDAADGLYLPFGPAMIVAGLVAMFVVPF
jgi:hypothetical protein